MMADDILKEWNENKSGWEAKAKKMTKDYAK